MLGRTDLPADLSDGAALDRLDALLPRAPVVASTLRRAGATVDALARGRPRLPDEPDLREFDFGRWDGRPFTEVDGPELRAFFDDPGARRAPDGESWNDVAARVSAAVARLAAAAEAPDLILVAHLGPILTQWAAAAGLPPARAVGQEVRPLSLTRIDLAGGAALRATAVEVDRVA
jgi:broad specificity phosphatase PhoE